MRSAFWAVDAGADRLAASVVALSAGTDVYVGAALRSRRGGDRASVGQAWVVWADCDDLEARERLATFQPAPSLVVASGTPGHLHAYWALVRPACVAAVEEVNRRLAASLGADFACVDAGRILRPPGTLNHKGGMSRPVRVLATPRSPPHDLNVLLASVPAEPYHGRPVAAQEARRTQEDPLLAVSARTYVPVLIGQRLGRDSKVRCPFHQDRTPSLHAYAAPEQGWFCFGCRRGGSIYDFGAQLWGLEPRGDDFLRLRARLEAELAPGRRRGRGREL
jgi:hypothetical protein